VGVEQRQLLLAVRGIIGRSGDHVQRRPLDIYQAIGARLASSGGR
jgi:hypothetical protein